MGKIRNLLDQLFNIGVDLENELDEQHRVKFVNKMIFIGFVSVFIFSINDVFIKLYLPALLLFIESLFLIFCFYLTSRGYNNLSPLLAIFSASLVIFINAYIIKGDVGIQYILLSISGLTAISLSQKRKKLIFSVLLITPSFDREESVFIRVLDNGPGIPEKIKKEVFKPFFTTKPLGKGTGLGLSVAKGIIEKHNGEILIEKTTQGTSFLIRLPLVS